MVSPWNSSLSLISLKVLECSSEAIMLPPSLTMLTHYVIYD